MPTKFIVTGANSGIGKEVALSMGRDCANVVVNYISDPASAEEVVHQIEQRDTGAKAIAVKADVSMEDQVQEMFRVAKQHFGTVDILVNNAGLLMKSMAQELGPKGIRWANQINRTIWSYVPHKVRSLVGLTSFFATLIIDKDRLKNVPDFVKRLERLLKALLDENEMTSSEEGFYSSLDADSEGQEGKF